MFFIKKISYKNYLNNIFFIISLSFSRGLRLKIIFFVFYILLFKIWILKFTIFSLIILLIFTTLIIIIYSRFKKYILK